MGNLRHAYAATQFANLDWNENTERPIDRVAAAGKAEHLEIWKSKYSGDVPSIRKLYGIALAVFRLRYTRDQNAERITEQAIHEFLDPNCRACSGSGNVKSTENINESIPCGACHGSGTGKHSDESRAIRMQLSYATTKHSAHKITWLVGWLTTNDKEINILMNRRLERNYGAITMM